MTRTEFEQLVLKALSQMPESIRDCMDNVDLVVDEWPSGTQLAGANLETAVYLLGLYEGIPLTERYGYNMVIPDKITLFQKPIEALCSDDEHEIMLEVKNTVVHEVAHHFGIEDDKLLETH